MQKIRQAPEYALYTDCLGPCTMLYRKATVGTPYRRPRLAATRSWASLDMPYGFCGLLIRSGVGCADIGPAHTGHATSHRPSARLDSERMSGVCSPCSSHR